MTNPTTQHEHDTTHGSEAPEGGRARSCVGCGERVDRDQATTDMVRLIVSPGGEVVVDARGGGFGRGAWVHPRPDCLEKAVQRGLARSAKMRVHAVVTDDGGDPQAGIAPLGVRSLALAIQHAMDRRIEGLVASAVRSRRVALGADAVTDACRAGDAELVLVARDAAAAADLTEVRRAVAEGRAVAWGTKERLAAVVFPGSSGRAGEGLGVLAILSRPMAGPLRLAVQTADACAAIASGEGRAARGARATHPAEPGGRAGRREKGVPPGAGPGRDAERGGAAGDPENSSATSACTPPAEGGELRPRQGGAERKGSLEPDGRASQARPPFSKVGDPRSRSPRRNVDGGGPRSRAPHEGGQQVVRGERGADGSTRGRRRDG